MPEFIWQIIVTLLASAALGGVTFIWTNHLRHTKEALTRIEKKMDEGANHNREDHEKFFDRIGELERDVGILKDRK